MARRGREADWLLTGHLKALVLALTKIFGDGRCVVEDKIKLGCR